MLKIQKKRRTISLRAAILCMVFLIVGTGIYFFALVLTPAIASVVAPRAIAVSDLGTPKENRIIIPRLGVDIPYDKGPAALDRGAEWQSPDRGNPVAGGNFIIAAYRLSIQPTPQSTLEKSPFYNIDKLVLGDKIIIDYSGKRYAYEVTKKFTIKTDKSEIEAPSDTPKLTLYSFPHSGENADSTVLISNRLGEVATTSMHR